ncbi:MAG TPA: hypothetical protein VND65_05845 [Candidatus Binatia bacterium]|nr:hypothetical protein [Candidatus Binatia bacterium]
MAIYYTPLERRKMTEWIPPVSAMSEERYAILQLVRLCKRYQARAMATGTALQQLYPENRLFVERVRALSQRLLENSQQEVEIEYRAIESALADGTDYVSELLQLLDRHRPRQNQK